MLWKGELNMLTAMYEEMDGRYGRWLDVQEIDSENLRRARAIFDDYKKLRGNIK